MAPLIFHGILRNDQGELISDAFEKSALLLLTNTQYPVQTGILFVRPYFLRVAHQVAEIVNHLPGRLYLVVIVSLSRLTVL